jgi:hypothetical protein
MLRPSHGSSRRRSIGVLAAAALIAVAVSIPATAVADEPPNVVSVWNANAVSVISAAPTADPPGLGQGPPLAALETGMVHGAVYDAVNAIVGGHEPYLDGLSAPSSANKDAAVIAAASYVLLHMLDATPTGTPPAIVTRVTNLRNDALASLPDGPAKTAGIQIGTEAGTLMIANRSTDGRFDVEPFATSLAVGKWRPVPPLSNNVQGQFVTVKPLTMRSPDQFRTEGPLDMASDEYTAEFNEVKALGAQTGSSRTAAQQLLAGFVFGNPLVYMNKGLRDIAAAQGLSTAEQALLFVKTSMASADALIGCWSDKAHHGVWRPQTAIHEALNDGNPDTAPDPDWISLFPTPGYPDHPSGYNCYTQGLWYSARLFFGTDRMDFSLTSPGAPLNLPTVPISVPGSTRDYTRFSDVTRDTIEGRILTGFHFRTADVQGAWIGKKAAQWIDKHYFAPID